ncbi:Sec1-like protein [Thelephora ganbajun]|uniref:Sec1-like protein n=1 Tax=Thelephora ganbajun TaxID=370292 RepID=A0ACB6ZMG3_THEGA|nr:Sec1-like protein [Thelephora ganbajun]
MAAPPTASSSKDEQRIPHLSRLEQDEEPGPDVSVLKEIGRKALIDSLNSVNGAKTLVLDNSIAGPLGLVTDVSLLKYHGVDKMFWLESGPLTSTTTNVVYLCRPLIRNIKIPLRADQIKRHAKESQKHIYTLILIPRVSTLVNRILEEEGVLGEINISSYNLQFIPLAEDVVSLENDNAFKEIWVDGDETSIYDSAQALVTLQKLFGPFPRVLGKGNFALRLSQLLDKESALLPTSNDPSIAFDKFDSLIILDRRIDMITPLLTQLTYEGLVDELVGIKNSYVELPQSVLAPQTGPGAQPTAGLSTSTAPGSAAGLINRDKKKKHNLSASADPLFEELRDLNFSAVGKKLNKVAHRLDEDYKRRHQAETVAQLKDFVGKLGGLQNEHQSLGLHTRLSEMLVPLTRTTEFNRSLEIQQNLLASYDVANQITSIEDMIAQGADMQVIVRLLCLASITSGGIKTKILERIKRDFLQTYGYNLIPLLLSLAAPPLCILQPNPLHSPTPYEFAASKYPFASLRKSLRLLIDDIDNVDDLENDISYVYSGYAPISIRLVQCVAQKGGVLSNPALNRANIPTEGERADGAADTRNESVKVQAHPVVGWKGFEDVLASIPGETVDFVPKGLVPANMVNPGSIVRSTYPERVLFWWADPGILASSREQTKTTTIFFLGGCTYTEIAAIRWVAKQNRGRRFLIATTGIISGRSVVERIAGVSPGSGRDASI